MIINLNGVDLIAGLGQAGSEHFGRSREAAVYDGGNLKSLSVSTDYRYVSTIGNKCD